MMRELLQLRLRLVQPEAHPLAHPCRQPGCSAARRVAVTNPASSAPPFPGEMGGLRTRERAITNDHVYDYSGVRATRRGRGGLLWREFANPPGAARLRGG